MKKIKAIYAGLLIALGLAIILFFIFLTRKKDNALKARRSCRIWFNLCQFKLEKIGEWDEEARLIIMNHQSMTDILCLEAYHPQNICWIAKKQLGNIPFYGYALRGTEMILIDREDKKGLAILLKSTKQKLLENRPIVIFPEGTRGPGKKDFLPFKSGAKILAEKFNLKIQPIVLVHTKKLFNTTPLETLSNTARMIILPSFLPSCSNWYEELQKMMQEVYLKHYKDMESKLT